MRYPVMTGHSTDYEEAILKQQENRKIMFQSRARITAVLILCKLMEGLSLV